MNAQEFCYWCQGYLEVAKPETIGKVELQEIKNHLELVLKSQIPFICTTSTNVEVEPKACSPFTESEKKTKNYCNSVKCTCGTGKVCNKHPKMICGCPDHPMIGKNEVTKQFLHLDTCNLTGSDIYSFPTGEMPINIPTETGIVTEDWIRRNLASLDCTCVKSGMSGYFCWKHHGDIRLNLSSYGCTCKDSRGKQGCILHYSLNLPPGVCC